MYELASVLISNSLGAALMIIVLVSTAKYKRLDLTDEKLFDGMVIVTLMLCITEACTFIIDGRDFPGNIIIARILNSLLFMGQAPLLLMWVCYVDYKIHHNVQRIKMQLPLIALPAMLVACFGAANIFTDIFFTITENNVYQRTNISFLPATVMACYFLYATCLILYNRRLIRKRVFYPLFLFMLIPIAGGLIQVFFYGIAVMWVSAAIGLITVYINVQNERSSVDSLTGLYNRIYMERCLDRQRRRTQTSRKIAGIMIDADDFKLINDSFGHGEGDAALVAIGKSLLESSCERDIVARYAGDEFIVITHIHDESEIEILMKKIRRTLNAYNSSSGKLYTIELSMGYAVMDEVEDDSTDKFLSRMDKKLYSDKFSHKHEKSKIRVSDRT